NAADRAQARKRRVSPGGSIMIHGLPNGWAKIGKMHLLRDWTDFYKSIHITYPNAADRAQARKRRVSPGGSIMIHGLPNGWAKIGKMHLLRDWTDGCIAVTNEEMDEIWKLVRDGTPIEIKP
ncbi:MAG: L,D-transpeptidase family protein, partial [Acidobacteria bacterium]|nr:L,D-transpeptidase family protein [Acidobacteriota bacterium]